MPNKSLDALQSKGLSETHIQLLKKFLVLQGQEVRQSALLRGTKGGAPIPADSIVKVPHYLHNLVRGVYKPRNDRFALSIQTNPSSRWGAEIDFEASKWLIEYDFGPSQQYRQDIQALMECFNDSIPIGVVYKVRRGVNRVLGLGTIKSVKGTKFSIIPYSPDSLTASQVDASAASLVLNETGRNDYSSRGGKRTILGRQKMKWYKDRLTLEYDGHCAFCGLTVKRYLIASHIVDYSTMQKEDPENSMNPSNGLLLCRLCDVAFERGDIKMTKNLTLEVSTELLQRTKTDETLKAWLSRLTKRVQPSGLSGFPPLREFIERKENLVLETHKEGFVPL